MFWESNNHEFFMAGSVSPMTYMDTRDPMRVERGDHALDLMERYLQNGHWFVGKSITIADVALVACTRQAHLGGFDLPPRPKLKQLVGRCESELGLLGAAEAPAH